MPIIYDLSKPVEWNKIKEKVYADTNIISPIYYDQAAAVPNQINMAVSRIYQQALSNMFAEGIQLYVSSVVILEMINLFIKWDLKIYNRTQANRIGELKKYRELPSEMNSRGVRYPLIYQQISSATNIVIDETRISANELALYINSLGTQSMDPNDYAIIRSAKASNAILMTNDHDYGSPISDCDIMTQNQDLINKCIHCGYVLAN